MEFVCKILLCGDGAVGKTSLRKKYIGLSIGTQYLMTIGADLSIKTENLVYNDQNYTLKCFLWDLAGQPNFKIVRPRYYSGGHAAFVVYDITNKNSFNHVKNWISEIKQHNRAFPIPIILVANKIDLRDQSKDPVSPEKGKEYAEKLSKSIYDGKWDVPFIETSALTGENVNLAFEKLGKSFIESALKTN
ncbi:MAG: GTP-binding protein [Candidatus Hodarchaeales archaeon]